MALVLKAASATFTKHLGNLYYPVTRGLVGAYYLGSAQRDHLRNFAPGGSSLTVLGTPTVNTYSEVMGTTSGYETGLPETESFTFISVAKRGTDDSQKQHVGNFNSDAVDVDTGCYVGMWRTDNAAAQIGYRTSGVNQAVEKNPMPAAIGDVTMIAGVVDVPNSLVSVYASGAGLVKTTAALAAARTLDSAYTIKLSYSVAAGQAGSVEMYAAAVHNVALTEAELAQVYAFLKARYAAVGVTIL